ncbi:beta-ketoacyl-ACP synthase III [Kitasatospora azatica]|uniref:beta-ketoacyl-ACP synthase III n=1 Tax=Kitasatospora azatica TaxID=58347 RepID=UPI000564648B|nr:beta-ketoacyl-ACP synthase III [Kitasatospora azatica]
MTRAAVLESLGGFLPAKVVPNSELVQRMDTTDEWIRTRTGIRQRHVVSPGQATSDLAVEAGRSALDSALGSGVDLVLLATTTPDRPVPATAPEVATRLGLRDVPAFDIGAGCSGFLYGLATARAYLVSGAADRVLMIGADAFSTYVDPTDRTTAPIFGDGAGAVVLRAGTADELGALGPLEIGSDGELAELTVVAAGGSRQRGSGVPPEPADGSLVMRGKDLFMNAVMRMSDSARSVLKQADWELADIDCFIGHQANRRILDAVGEELGLAEERVAVNIDQVGNTVAASIPLAMADAVRQGRLSAGDRVLLAAFGAGATWGAATLRWPATITA